MAPGSLLLYVFGSFAELVYFMFAYGAFNMGYITAPNRFPAVFLLGGPVINTAVVGVFLCMARHVLY